MTVTVAAGLDAAQRSTLERLVIRAARAAGERPCSTGRGSLRHPPRRHHRGRGRSPRRHRPTRSRAATSSRSWLTCGRWAKTRQAPSLAFCARRHSPTSTDWWRSGSRRRSASFPSRSPAGPQSRGFKDLGEIMPMLAGDYRAIRPPLRRRACCRRPRPVRPAQPAARPRAEHRGVRRARRAAGRSWNDRDLAAPDTLGWAYQFFNTGDERREMREASRPAQLPRARRPQPVLHAALRRRLPRPEHARPPARRGRSRQPAARRAATARRPADRAWTRSRPRGREVSRPGLRQRPLPARLLRRARARVGTGRQSHPRNPRRRSSHRCGASTSTPAAPRSPAPRSFSVPAAIAGTLPLPRPNIVTARGLPGGSAALAARTAAHVPPQRDLSRPR